ncbi:MAG: hypothetical protein J5730_04065 [Bacteroidales bacterium]|nr:hypothetical protein [Bacteroidales bacterium]
MKKILIICTLATAMLLCNLSCQRGVRSLLGDYSYKISGEVTLTNEDGEVTHLMVNKRGQMNILRDRLSEGRVTITLNESTGGAYYCSALVKGDSLIVDQYTFSTNILTSDNINPLQENSSLVFSIIASGKGIHNGDIIMIEEQWSGMQSSNDAQRLEGRKMLLLAEKNE